MSVTTIHFPKLGHFWLDSGLVGLESMLRIVDTPAEINVNEAGISLTGEANEIERILYEAYDALVKQYYNVSTKKQRDDTSSWNFYYNLENDVFEAFPKRKSVGIASLIFDKAARKTGSQVKWKSKPQQFEITIGEKVIKRKRATLPNSHSYLQERLDTFLDKNDLNAGPDGGLLVDGPNAVKPKMKIKVDSKATKGVCYLCGEPSNLLEEASQTTFPLLTGSSGVLSFNPGAGAPEKVCWKCSLRGKFVPVNGFYLKQGDCLFAFFPFSTSLQKMIDSHVFLQDALYEHPNYFRNFQHPLGSEKNPVGFFQRPFEVSFAFLYTIYNKLLKYGAGTEDSENVLDIARMCDLTLSKAPLEFVVLEAQSKGQTTMTKMVWPFRDTVYFFRLLDQLERGGVNIKEVMHLYINFQQPKFENKTIIRNRICERILKKQSILDLTETHVFRADVNYVKPLLDFLVVYEQLVQKEGSMTEEEQQAAVQLGKRLGMAVGHGGKKGDLFRLRKARKQTDFLNEINRLQFKFNLAVPPDVYDGKLTEENFTVFKQFCMIAALNSFNAATSTRGGEK